MKNKPIAPFLSKALNISMILLIIASLMNTGAVKTVQASYDPTFLVRLTENQVHGYGWNLDDTVTLTINDPEGDDFTDYQTVIEADWDPLQTIVFFDLGEFKLKPGQEVSMSDESTTKTHIVRDLAVTVMDPEHDIVSGTAEPGSEVYVGEVCDKTSCTFRFVTADPSSGEWVADFSTPGDDPDKEVVVDIVPGTSGEVHQGDDDGNETMIHWRVPAPYIKASPSEDWVQAFDWPDGAELALTIDDPSNGDNVDKTATATAETAPGNPNEIIAEFNLEGFDLQPDFILEVTDETITRTLTVTNLAVTGFDLDNDTITGTGDPDQEVQVCVNGPDRCYTRYATSDGDGNWTVDYAHAGSSEDEQDLVDLQPGSEGWAAQYDANGNQTWFDWRVINPRIEANPIDNWVQARDWPDGAELALTINDSSHVSVKTATATVVPAPWNPNETMADFDLEGFDLQPDFILEVTDVTNGTTRTLTVANLAVIGFDLDNDTITGTGVPDQEVQVCVNDRENCMRSAIPGGDGIWTVNYAQPEEDSVDLKPGSSGWAAQVDDDGDQTRIDWRIANPWIEANPINNWVHARDWPDGAELALTIDDPSNGDNVDKTATATAETAPWNPNETVADFDLEGFDLQPDFILEVTDGTTARTMTVTNLAVTVFDVDADMISGVGDPDQEVQVCVNAPDRCYTRYATSDGDGNWTVDYAHAGPREDEYDLVDLQPGSEGWAAENDSNGNRTMVDWRIANPWIEANPIDNWVQARDWPDGAELALTIDDPSNGDNVDKTATATAETAPWNPNETMADFDLDGFDLQPDFILEVTDGTTARTMTVANLAVTGFDVDADTITGTGDPGQEVQVCVNGPDRCYIRYATSDGDGEWTVDYAHAGPREDEQDTLDLQPGNDGWAAQVDDDGDQTRIDWWVLNPWIEANPIDNWVHARDWPDGAELTLTIDDPSTSTESDKTVTAVVGPASWNPNEIVAEFNLDGFDLQPDFILEVTDGTTARTMTVANLAVTGFDLDNDTITGTGDPDQEVQVCVNAPDRCYIRYATSDGDGNWTVDYANPGPREDEQDTLDLQPGNDGWAAQVDDNGNQTWIDWWVLNPWIEANLTGNWVHARDWPDGAELTLTIYDSSHVSVKTATATVVPAPWNPNETMADFDLEGFDLQPDFILEVTDGTTARTMTVANLAVTGFDLDNDTITGTGVPDQEVQVCVNGPDRCYIRYATSDGDGEWTVDYAHAGPREDEQDTLELQPGSEGWAAETDSNGNRTIVDWRIANPWIEANLTGNWVQARDWPDGAELALTINDPSNGDNVDKTATATVGPAPWNPNETMADFDLEGFDLQPDFILEVTDGTNGTTRTMTTANLGVTGFDISTDTITGVGDADLEVQVCVDLSDNCYSRYATPESTKVWAVDYANPGSREDEQDLTDLRAGSFGWAAQNDPQGNRTRIDWKVPSPYISDIADQTTDEDTATDAIPFVIDDADVSPESLTISAESSDTELVPVENISFEGSGMERTITIQPAPDLYGSATITVTVDNGSEQSPASFELTVNAVNDPPTLTLTNKTTSLPENTSIASAMMVAEIVVTDDDLGTNTLALSGADAALFEIMGSELRLKAGTVLDFETKPVLNVTVEVSDLTLGGTPDDSETLTINITDVNEAPVITEDEPVMVTMSRNGNPQQFSLTLHATDEDQNSTLTWKVSIPAQHGTATVSGTGTSKMISYTPAADYSGTDSFVVEVSDGEGGKDTITVNVTITKINQIFLPTIVK